MGLFELADQEMKDREHFMREYMVLIDGEYVSVWDQYMIHKHKMEVNDSKCVSCGRCLWQVGELVVGHKKTYCRDCAAHHASAFV